MDFSDWSDQHRALFTDLRAAITEKRVVSFQYYARDRSVSRRVAEPVQLRFKSRAWYLWAYCRTAQQMRTFKLTRMTDLALTDEHFQRVVADEPPAGFNPYAAPACPPIVLRIDKSLTYRVLNEFAPDQTQCNEDGSYTVTACFPLDDWVVGYVLSFGSGAQVVEPPALRDAVRSELKKTLSGYAKVDK